MADRLVRVEEKIAFIDHHLKSLDEIVRQQADRLDRLERQMMRFLQEGRRELIPEGEGTRKTLDQPND